MAGTDFSHLTTDELIKGIKALDLPDYIRSKAYGIDVRETLAQMTEMTIQLGVNMGLSPDEALKWARKLQDFDEQLAQTEQELNQKKRDKAQLIDLDELTPRTISAIEGGGGSSFELSSMPKSYSVSPTETTFVKTGKNLFDKNNTISGIKLNQTDGSEMPDDDWVSSKFERMSADIDLISNTVILYVFYDEDYQMINYKNVLSGAVVTTPPNTRYFRVSTNKGNKEGLQVELGTEVTSYEPYYAKVEGIRIDRDDLGGDVNDLLVEVNRIQSTIARTKNLYDKNRSKDGFTLSGSDGSEQVNEKFTASDFELVNGDTSIIGNYIAIYTFYDINRNFISFSNVAAETPVVTPSNASYFRVSTNRNNKEDFQVELGTEVTSYEPYGTEIKNLLLPKKWSGKLLSTVGDSLTNNKQWQQTVLKNCGFSEYKTYGAIGLRVASTAVDDDRGYIPLWKNVKNVDKSSDYVTFLGGTNDFGASIPLGDYEEELNKETPDNFTFYGALISSVEWLSENLPSARIIFITPPPRHNRNTRNSAGHNLEDYVNAIIRICNHYSIPVFDLYRNSGLNDFNHATYTLPSEGSNWLHFTPYGYEQIFGEKISAFINSLG